MLRGSTDLIKRSTRHFVRVVKAIAEAPAKLWDVDAHSYSDDALNVLEEFESQLKKALPKASDILVAKIMLGVFGNVAAFDTYFKKGSGLSKYGRNALRRIEQFYWGNTDVIERYRKPTLDFETGIDTRRVYTSAKVSDMIYFIEGGGRADSDESDGSDR